MGKGNVPKFCATLLGVPALSFSTREPKLPQCRSILMGKQPITPPTRKPAEPDQPAQPDPQPYEDPVKEPPHDPPNERPLTDPIPPDRDLPRM